MKNKKAFTLVELIVVITILAILWTIAFISFWKNIVDAKNTKVLVDLTNISKKINIMYNRAITFDQIIKNDINVKNRNGLDTTTAKVNSWHLLNETWTAYNVWNINFNVLKEKRTNFLDLKNRDYIFAYVSNHRFVKFELIWETYNSAWIPTILIKWSYFPKNNTDVTSLISASGSTTPVKNKQTNTELY